MASNDKQIERLRVIKTKIEESKDTRSRLQGELDIHKKQIESMEKECREKYGIAIEQLPSMISDLEKKADESLRKAEEILRL